MNITGRLVISLAIAITSLGAGAETLPRDQLLRAEQAIADVALARRTLQQLHAGYDRYVDTGTLDAAWTTLQAQAAVGMTRGRLYLELSRLLAMIRCDHTKAEIPDDFQTSRKSEPVYLPFRFKLFNGRMYVATADQATTLARGDEVLTIDGEPVSALVADVLPLFPVDGDTDYVKEPSISELGEFMGPAFDHFMPFLRPIQPKVTLSIRSADNGEAEVVLDRLSFTDFAALTGERRFSANFVDAVHYKPIGDDAAYLAVDTFINYRKPVNPDKLYRPIFDAMAGEGRDRLILDLRKNGGGSDEAQEALLRWIATAPIQQASAVWTRMNHIDDDLKPYLSTWDKAALNPKKSWFEPLDNGYYKVISKRAGAPGGPLKPRKNAFAGELVLLTSHDNASAVTHMLAALKGAGRGTLIGEPTGGAATGATAGILLFLNLPNSAIRVRVPLQRTVIASRAQFDPRLGLQPDIEALDTLDSFLSDSDPALEAATAYLAELE